MIFKVGLIKVIAEKLKLVVGIVVKVIIESQNWFLELIIEMIV